MKQVLSTLLISLLCFSVGTAQEIRLNGYAGYVFDDRVDAYSSNTSYYEGTVKGGLRWGAELEYHTGTNGIGLLYLRQDSDVPMQYYDLIVKNQTFKLGINWIMLNFNRYVPKGKAEPYAGGGLGVAILNLENPETGSSTSKTKFAWNIKLGANILASERVGIKLQADLFSAVQSVGGSLYFGTGGAGAGVSSYSSMLQFGLGGGLVFRFPQSK